MTSAADHYRGQRLALTDLYAGLAPADLAGRAAATTSYGRWTGRRIPVLPLFRDGG